METSDDRSYEDLLQKIIYLQKKVDSDYKDRSKLAGDSRSQLLQDLSKRYGEDNSLDLERSTRNVASSEFNSREKYSDILKSNDSKFLDDFFGVKKFEPTINDHKIVQDSDILDFKNDMTSKFEKSLSESIFLSSNFKISSNINYEWIDFKLSLNSDYFHWRKNYSILYDEQIESNDEQKLKIILEFLHSKVRFMNFETLSQTHIKNFIEFETIDFSASQKNILRAAIEVINFLLSNNFNIDNRNTPEYDLKLLDFSIGYFSRNFKEFFSNYSNKSNIKFPRLFSRSSDLSANNIQDISSFYVSNSRFPISSVNEIPNWFILYNLLRVSDYEAAISIMNSLSPNFHILSTIIKCLKNYTTISLKSRDLEDLQNLANSCLKNSKDPYEKLLVSLLTFSQIDSSYLQPLETIEEFVWFKLLRLRLSILISAKTFKNPLLMIQEELENDFESKEFSVGIPSSLVFSQSTCLFIVGDFEKGIQNLCRDKVGLIFSMHLAILFFNGNLLRTSVANHQPLISVEDGEIRSVTLNIGNLVTNFFYNFCQTLEIYILDYFIAFKNHKKSRQEILSLASNLLIYKFSDFDPSLMLLWFDKEGVQPFSEEYVECAVSMAEYFSSIHENFISLSLYSKINKLDKIVGCLTELLTQMISSRSTFSLETAEELEKFSSEIGDRVLVDKTLNNSESSYFLLLLDLTFFFKDLHNNNYSSALKIANQLQIVPINYSQIQKCLEKIASYPTKLRLIYRHILQGVVKSIQNIYEISKYKTGKMGIQEVNILREQASALLSFTSQMTFPMLKSTRTEILSCLADLRKKL